MVDSQGKITARGGGNIAGWNIEDDKLFNGNVGMAPKNWILKEENNQQIWTGVFWAGKPENSLIRIPGTESYFAKRNFFVTGGGFLFSKSGQIAGWNIEEDKLFQDNVGMAPKNWVLREEKVKVEGTIQKRPIYTGVFWAGEPDEISSIRIPGTNSYFAKRNFFVTGGGFLFSKAGNIGGWKIAADKLTNEAENVGISSGIKLDNDDIRTVCFWSGKKNSSYSTENMNFYVDTIGFLFSKYGQIGNWFIGSGGLYNSLKEKNIVIEQPYTYEQRIAFLTKRITNLDKMLKQKGKTQSQIDYIKAQKKKAEDEKTELNKAIKEGEKKTNRVKLKLTEDNFGTNTNISYENTKNTSAGAYLGSDGIRLGKLFHVDSNGLYAIKGTIGGIEITGDGLYATNWQITGDGTATFAGATINGSSINKALAISGSSGGGGISGGGMHMGASGSGPGSSYMSPQVKTGEDGKSWEEYIKDTTKDVVENENFWDLKNVSCNSLSIGQPGHKKSLTDYIKDVIDDDYVKAIISDAYIKEHVPKPASPTPTTP
jgi:hypothetical protein